MLWLSFTFAIVGLMAIAYKKKQGWAALIFAGLFWCYWSLTGTTEFDSSPAMPTDPQLCALIGVLFIFVAVFGWEMWEYDNIGENNGKTKQAPLRSAHKKRQSVPRGRNRRHRL